MASHDRRLNTFADFASGLPRRTSELHSQKLYSTRIKPLVDFIFAAIIMVPAAFVIGIFAILVALDGSNPFYRQSRIGENGREFKMWKLRSMVPNADQVLEAYLASDPQARDEWNRSQKLKNDPRITLIGRFIRKSSIDELPQIFNVLRGEMSLVGPRPMMLDQRVLYPGLAYYAMRPGITGFWQTSERNDTSFAERATYDASYFKAMSFGTDMRVMFKTVAVVFAGTGY